jgi:hypothetical protein
MRLQGNLDAVRVPSPTAKPNLLVNKPLMVLNSVQNRFNFELDGRSPFGEFVCCSNHRLTRPSETRHLPLHLFVSQPRCWRRAPCAFFFNVVDSLTLPTQVTHKLCYRAILLNVGCGGRVVLQILTDFIPSVAFRLVGVTGFIEVTALAWWGVELWHTMNLSRTHRAQLLRAPLPVAAG